MIRIEHREMPLTFNEMRRGAARWALSNEVKKWRAAMAIEMKLQGLQPLHPPVRVVVHHLRKNRSGMPDVGAPVLAVKASIDAMVDQGLIPSDGPDVVTELTYLAPEVVGYHGLAIEVVELGDQEGVRPL